MTTDSPRLADQVARCAAWPERFAPEDWLLYRRVITEARSRGLRFAVGGGLAAMTYAGQWRDTKDLDLYILHQDRDRMISVVTELGLRDYFEKLPYDRNWIYRSYTGAIIVDLIWAMANRRALVDESWLQGPEVEADGLRFRLLAPEEALWSKLYVLQRERTDWPDALNLLYGVGPEIDWCRLLQKLGHDTPLLSGLLAVFAWLAPPRARQLPAWIWSELGIRSPKMNGESTETIRERAQLLDTRPWFTPTLQGKE